MKQLEKELKELEHETETDTTTLSKEAQARGWKRTFTFNNDALLSQLKEIGFKWLYYEAPYYFGLWRINKVGVYEIVTTTEDDTDIFQTRNKEAFFNELESLITFFNDYSPSMREEVLEVKDSLKELDGQAVACKYP